MSGSGHLTLLRSAPVCALAAGVRVPQAPALGGAGAGGLTNDQLAQLAQLGLLSKPPAPQQQPAGLGITPQQQAALLNALQVSLGGSADTAISYACCAWPSQPVH